LQLADCLPLFERSDVRSSEIDAGGRAAKHFADSEGDMQRGTPCWLKTQMNNTCRSSEMEGCRKFITIQSTLERNNLPWMPLPSLPVLQMREVTSSKVEITAMDEVAVVASDLCKSHLPPKIRSHLFLPSQ
jgi:hypothetical protein